MLHPLRSDWHIGHNSPWLLPYPGGGVAPSRADEALARYLEKRAAHVELLRYRPALGTALRRLLVRMLGGGRPVLPMPQARHRATP